MAQYVVTDTELAAVADAIRVKGGTSADLEWTSGYIAAIRAISGGGASGYYWRVRYYSQDGAVLVFSEFVEDGMDCTYAYANLGWSLTPGGSAISGVTEHVSGNLDLYFTGAYTPIGYIEATGTQWINTGVPGNTAGLRVELMVQPLAVNYDQGVFGNAWAADGFFLMIYGTGGRSWRFHTGGIAQNDGVASTADFAHIVLETTGFSVDGVSYPMTGGANRSGDLRIFNNFGSSYGYNASARLKAAKIYSGTTLLKDLIPAIDPNGVVCLYDLVGSTYLYNAGTGSFIAP